MKRWSTIVLAVALAACGGGAKPSASTSPSPSSSRIASTGRIEILSPTAGATVEGPDVTIHVKLTGAHLVKKASLNIKPDTGHIHVKLDGRILTLLAGLTYTAKGVPAGQHLIEVEFVAADHGPFYPDVKQTITLRVT